MSHEQLIEMHLKSGKTITPLQALRKWGCLRLGARIYGLRKRMDIHTELVERGGKRFARYSLQ